MVSLWGEGDVISWLPISPHGWRHLWLPISSHGWRHLLAANILSWLTSSLAANIISSRTSSRGCQYPLMADVISWLPISSHGWRHLWLPISSHGWRHLWLPISSHGWRHLWLPISSRLWRHLVAANIVCCIRDVILYHAYQPSQIVCNEPLRKLQLLWYHREVHKDTQGIPPLLDILHDEIISIIIWSIENKFCRVQI